MMFCLENSVRWSKRNLPTKYSFEGFAVNFCHRPTERLCNICKWKDACNEIRDCYIAYYDW